MADGFEAAVEDGLRLSKRIYFGKDRAVAPPKPAIAMEREPVVNSYLPRSPMIYAVIGNPAIVDNPDIPSYQPHVHGRCDPPALIPLQMNGISLEVDCYLDTAVVTVTGSWRVHCVMGSRCCECRLAVPMGEQGSILGVEVDIPWKSYSTQLTAVDNERDTGKGTKIEDGSFLKPHIFTMTIPQIDGGTNISVKFSWSQKLLCSNGQFTLKVPFTFPDYVTPAGKKISKRERIQLNVNSGPGTEVLCKTTSHPLKELKREAGKLAFSYESEVLTWSSSDLFFTYMIPSTHTFGSVLLSSPSLLDIDQREMFCCTLFPGNQPNGKVFRKEVVFVVDISGSMREKPLDDTKSALFAALSKLNPEDLFSVIAFNNETYLFSSSMTPATPEAVVNATQWINLNFIAGGGTNILLPLNQAIEMLRTGSNSCIPIVFLITDGAVEDERHICDVMKSQLTNQQKICPRIYTLGIGSFCNHYFLRMLALIGRGYYDAAYDADSIEGRIGQLFSTAASSFLANISLELNEVDDLEVFPARIPDLSSAGPLIISGRYRGRFPETLKVKGSLADVNKFYLDLKVQDAKGIPIGRILAKQQIELLTAQAWFSENKELEEKIAKVSVANGVVSEYTQIVLLETERGRKGSESTSSQQTFSKVDPQKTEDSRTQKRIGVYKLGIGFGNLHATAENIRLGREEKGPDAGELFVKATSNCCGKLCGHCCCMCCIKCCSKMNDQCAIALTQLCGALSCLGCSVCCEACCNGDG